MSKANPTENHTSPANTGPAKARSREDQERLVKAGMTGARGRQPEKRERILAAALTVFSRKTYHQVKVEEIAAEARVGKGTVYEYFSSKEQLFQETYKENMGIYLDIYDLCREESLPFWEKAARIIRRQIILIQDNEELTRFMMESHSHLLKEVRDWIIQKHVERDKIIQEMIRMGIQKKEIREVDIKTAARVFAGGLISTCSEIAFLEEKLNVEQITQELLEVLKHGLGSPPQAGTPPQAKDTQVGAQVGAPPQARDTQVGDGS